MREIERFPEGLRRTERPPTHCLGWELRVFGQQGNDPEPGQARGLRGRRLGGHSLSWGVTHQGGAQTAGPGRENWAGVPRGSEAPAERPVLAVPSGAV